MIINNSDVQHCIPTNCHGIQFGCKYMNPKQKSIISQWCCCNMLQCSSGNRQTGVQAGEAQRDLSLRDDWQTLHVFAQLIPVGPHHRQSHSSKASAPHVYLPLLIAGCLCTLCSYQSRHGASPRKNNPLIKRPLGWRPNCPRMRRKDSQDGRW